MHLIIGGRFMGKLAYARSLYGEPKRLCDLSCEKPEDMDGADFIANVQDGVRTLLTRGSDVQEFFKARIGSLRECIIIADEIGSGPVPIDPFERKRRDETGLLYQMLAQEADIVDRVWAGLPMRLKRN